MLQYPYVTGREDTVNNATHVRVQICVGFSALQVVFTEDTLTERWCTLKTHNQICG